MTDIGYNVQTDSPAADLAEYTNVNAVCLGANSLHGVLCGGVSWTLDYADTEDQPYIVPWARFIPYDVFTSTSYCGTAAETKPVDILSVGFDQSSTWFVENTTGYNKDN